MIVKTILMELMIIGLAIAGTTAIDLGCDHLEKKEKKQEMKCKVCKHWHSGRCHNPRSLFWQMARAEQNGCGKGEKHDDSGRSNQA